jgi:hypothetical protein
MEYNITSFDHKQGTFVVLYNDDVYLNMPAPRKNGAYCTGQELENYIQWRHPSILKSHLADLEPLLVDENPNTDLPNEIIQKAALYQPEIQ